MHIERKSNKSEISVGSKEVEADELLQQDCSNTEEHEIIQLGLSVSEVTLDMETK